MTFTPEREELSQHVWCRTKRGRNGYRWRDFRLSGTDIERVRKKLKKEYNKDPRLKPYEFPPGTISTTRWIDYRGWIYQSFNTPYSLCLVFKE